MKNMYNKLSLIMFLLSMIMFVFGVFLNMNSMSIMLEFCMFSMSYYTNFFMLLFDWVSVLFISVILMIVGNVIMFSKDYMSEEIYPKRFMLLILLFVVSMLMMVLSPNLISILLGWDGLGLVSYCLVIYYQNYTAYNAGMITILSNRLGDFGLVLSILMLSEVSWNIMMMTDTKLFSMLIMLAAVTKSAQFPFSAWLPAAMSAPTPVSALVHSSTLVTAGVYLLIRFSNMNSLMNCNMVLMYMSLVTIILSGMSALVEQDMKKIVAMSTLSQLGFMMFVLSIGLWKIAYFHMLTHALFKSMLFLSVGNVMHSFSSVQDMRFMGVSSNFIISSGMGYLISSFCLFGLPFVSGFYSKEMIIKLIFNNSMNMMVIMMFIIGVILTMMYMIRMIVLSMMIMLNGFSYMSMADSKNSFMSVIILGFFSIIMGSILEWLIFDNIPLYFMTKYFHYSILLLIIFVLFINMFLTPQNKSMENKYQSKNLLSMMNLHENSSFFSLSLLKNEPSSMNDFYWGEFIGPQGIFKGMYMLGIFMFIQMMEFKLLFMILFILMMMFLMF